MKTPNFEIHSEKHGCYTVSTSQIEDVHLFTLISSTEILTEEVHRYISDYVSWMPETKVTALLIDLNEINVWETTALACTITFLNHICPFTGDVDDIASNSSDSRILQFHAFIDSLLATDQIP